MIRIGFFLLAKYQYGNIVKSPFIPRAKPVTMPVAPDISESKSELDQAKVKKLSKVSHSYLLEDNFEYSFSPETPIDSDLDAENNIVEDYLKEKAWELSKDAIGFGLVGLGSWLLNPAGPEDIASPGPVDEIVGGILIGAGRFLMWI